MNSPLNWTEFWNERWQKGAIGFHQNEVEGLLKKHLPELSPGLEVVIPLCGKSKDILFFAERGHPVIGIELSRIACEAFFTENHLSFEIETQDQFQIYRSGQIKIYCGDFFNFRPEFLQNMGMIYDRAALIALPADLRKRYSEHLIQISKAHRKSFGGLLIVAIDYDQSLKKGPPFSVSGDEIKLLYEKDFKIQLLESEPDRLGDLELIESAYWLTF